MPNTVVHEEVGYYLSKKLDISSYEYYLGLMAPDAVNVKHFANKQERWTSHVRDKDLNIWKENLKKFYKKEIFENMYSDVYSIFNYSVDK